MEMFDGNGGKSDFDNYVDYRVYNDITTSKNLSTHYSKNKPFKHSALILLIISTIIAVLALVVALIIDYHFGILA